MKLLYRPVAALMSALGGAAAAMVFRQLWRLATHEEHAPRAKAPEGGWRELLLAAGIEGATYGVVKAAIDRSGALGFSKLTGSWPAEAD